MKIKNCQGDLVCPRRPFLQPDPIARATKQLPGGDQLAIPEQQQTVYTKLVAHFTTSLGGCKNDNDLQCELADQTFGCDWQASLIKFGWLILLEDTLLYLLNQTVSSECVQIKMLRINFNESTLIKWL